MWLYWVVREINRKPSVFIVEAYYPIAAVLKAAIAGHAGKYKEVHTLVPKVAKRVPNRMIGRALSEGEVKALLKRMG